MRKGAFLPGTLQSGGAIPRNNGEYGERGRKLRPVGPRGYICVVFYNPIESQEFAKTPMSPRSAAQRRVRKENDGAADCLFRKGFNFSTRYSKRGSLCLSCVWWGGSPFLLHRKGMAFREFPDRLVRRVSRVPRSPEYPEPPRSPVIPELPDPPSPRSRRGGIIEILGPPARRLIG